MFNKDLNKDIHNKSFERLKSEKNLMKLDTIDFFSPNSLTKETVTNTKKAPVALKAKLKKLGTTDLDAVRKREKRVKQYIERENKMYPQT